MRRTARALVATSLLACGAAGGGTTPPTGMQAAISLWQQHRFPDAYRAILPYVRDQQFGRTPTPVFYLLTAGCRAGDARVAAWSKRTLDAYARDKRIVATEPWAEAFARESAGCRTTALPGGPPPRQRNAAGVDLDEPIPVYRLSAAYKRRCYAPGELPAASGAVTPFTETLPADVLSIAKAGGSATPGTRLVARFRGAAAVGRDVIVLGAVAGQNLGDVPQLANRFADQLQRDLGLKATAGYMFVVVYNQDTDDTLPGIPGFPGNEFTLGFSDSRPDVRTSYVLASPVQHGTVFHELTHQLMLANLGDMAPEWLDEGLASLFEETSAGRNGRFAGRPNWRGVFLRNPANRPSLAKIVGIDPFLDGTLLEDGGAERLYIKEASAMNAAERYLMLYLQEKGLLARTVAYYRDLAPGPDSDWPLADREARLRAFARATGIDPATGNAAFQRWLAATIAAQPAASFRIPTWSRLDSMRCPY